jgi:hypothetical protein
LAAGTKEAHEIQRKFFIKDKKKHMLHGYSKLQVKIKVEMPP